MSTDHPNGGSFQAYPQIIRLLMDRSYRREKLAEVNQKVLKHSQLADMDREYSLGEIAVITRAGPAKLLGLEHKGHLGAGADADITVYDLDQNYERMFELPHLVFKSGELVVENGDVRQAPVSRLVSAHPQYDRGFDLSIESWFEKHYSIPQSQFGR